MTGEGLVEVKVIVWLLPFTVMVCLTTHRSGRVGGVARLVGVNNAGADAGKGDRLPFVPVEVQAPVVLDASMEKTTGVRPSAVAAAV